jgi:hypothetical protein
MSSLSGLIRVAKAECFKIGSKVYVPFHKVSTLFEKRSNKNIQAFDKDDFIIHPTKGKLVCYPGRVVVTQ